MSDVTALEVLVLEVVRGERPLAALRSAGIDITELGDSKLEYANPSDVRAVASIRDVACGMIKYHADPAELVKWARIIEGSCGFLDLADEFETDPDGETLKDGLWQATFREGLSEEILQVARRRAS